MAKMMALPMTTTTKNDKTGRAGNPLRRLLASGMICMSAWFAAFALPGCTDMDTAPPVPAEAYVSKPSGNLAPGDEISVTFSGAPELNTKQKIQPNGKVSLPTVGDVTAGSVAAAAGLEGSAGASSRAAFDAAGGFA